MQLGKLLNDATGADESWSERQKHLQLHAMLQSAGHDISFKGVEKWFQRDRMPAWWLMKIVSTSESHGRPLDIKNYI